MPFHFLIGGVFKDFETVPVKREQVRYDQFTGEKIVTHVGFDVYKFKGKEYNDYMEFAAALSKETGLETYDLEPGIFIGTDLHDQLTEKEVVKLFKTIQTKFDKAKLNIKAKIGPVFVIS